MHTRQSQHAITCHRLALYKGGGLSAGSVFSLLDGHSMGRSFLPRLSIFVEGPADLAWLGTERGVVSAGVLRVGRVRVRVYMDLVSL